ncbi:MAG: YkgJ family cysteine cluster protein [Thermodesulfobacteriota bacterium]
MTQAGTPPDKGPFGFDTNPSNILPRKYTADSRIRFRCHPGVSCFTACCGTIKITLSPFDILRLRKRLGISAHELLLQYTTPIYLEKTDLPGVMLKLSEEGRCPFVTPNGCTVYSDRPTVCRYYPVGMANFHEGAQESQSAEEFYFIIQEPHCRGFEEDKTWTIAEWRQDQGVDVCDQRNKGWMELVMRRKSFGIQASLSEQAKKMFFMATNDLDAFRRFVLESSFLDTYEVDDTTLARIREDDIELMQFAFRFLASSLFGTQDLKIREEKIQAKVAQLKAEQERKAAEADQLYEELAAEREKLRQQVAEKKHGKA